MSLKLMHRFCHASAYASMALMAGCGGQSTSLPAVSVIDTPPAASPTAAPTPTPVSPVPPSYTMTSGVVVQSGDSIGAGLGAGDWAAIDHLGFASSVIIHNVSVVGEAMQTGYGQRTTDLFPFVNRSVASVLVIQQGTNDLYYGTSGDTLYKKILAPFVAAAQKAGFYVVVDTILPRADGGWTAGMEQQRILYNVLVRANGARTDAINDIAADALIGDGTGPATSSFYADGLHPTLAGQQRLAVLDAAILSSLLQRSPRGS